MKKEILSSLLLTIICIVFFSVIYTGVVWGVAQLAAPNKGEGFITRSVNGRYYYQNIAQSFTKDNYFWPRPSAVSYNAAGSGGSNKGPYNPDLLKQVQDRIDTFLIHNPGMNKADIPSDIVTASGSGLDPHISVQGAQVQVARVARVRGLDKSRVEALVKANVEGPFLGMGPQRVNVLQLNLALDELKTNN